MYAVVQFLSVFPWIILTFYWQLTKPFGALTILYAPWSFVFVHTSNIEGTHKYKYTQTQWQIQSHKNTNFNQWIFRYCMHHNMCQALAFTHTINIYRPMGGFYWRTLLWLYHPDFLAVNLTAADSTQSPPLYSKNSITIALVQLHTARWEAYAQHTCVRGIWAEFHERAW